DGLELGLVLAERGQRRLRDLRERGIGRGEDGQRSLAGERADESGLLDESAERLELPCPGGRLDDVRLRLRVRRGSCGRSSRCGCEQCEARGGGNDDSFHASLLVQGLFM